MSSRNAAVRAAASDPAPALAWRNRIVGHADVDPATLVTNPANWRRHPDHQRAALDESLTDIGWVQSVIVNRTTGHLVDGHARVGQALARGEPLVPVGYVELTPDEEKLVLATLDPIGALAEPDPAALTSLLASFEIGDGALSDLLALLRDQAWIGRPATVDPDEVIPLPKPEALYVRPGQIWQLDSHRIACGDALDAGLVARVLDGARPTLLATDPPYGVGLDLARRHRNARRRGAGHRNVAMTGDARADWSDAFELVPSLEVAYVWHPALHGPAVSAGLKRIGFEAVSEIIWSKSRWAVGRRWYHWQHESCLVARRAGVRVVFLGGRDQGTVWEAPSPKVGGPGADPKIDHPSQKPVALFDRPIRNHVRAGASVYDPFLGSGTTLIAAELAGRVCYGLELDPRYFQLVLERWYTVTGRRAELVADA